MSRKPISAIENPDGFVIISWQASEESDETTFIVDLF
jgi:hypothetical protein